MTDMLYTLGIVLIFTSAVLAAAHLAAIVADRLGLIRYTR